MNAPKKPAGRLAAALAPLDRGLAVLPLWWVQGGNCACGKANCDSPGKHPIGKLAPHGVKNATKDHDTIKRWWGTYPEANVGIATGRISGIVVLDVDPRNGGDKSLAKLQEKCGELVETYRVRTGGDGDHHYFKYSDELVATLKKLIPKKPPGLDVQADGRYVLGPGSNHISGRLYEVESHPLAAFEPQPFRPPKSKPTEEEKSVPDGLQERALRVLEEQCRVLAATEEGNRDNQENASGYTVGRHVAANALSYEDAFNKLFAAARLMKKPRSESEIRQKLEHGLRDGMKNPIADLSVPNYVVHGGRICHMKKNKDGPAFPVPLCNFAAAIVEEVVKDDGSGETIRVYVIEGSLPSGKRLPRIRVPAARFGSMNWPEELWGHDAVVEAGYNTKDMLRVAIHALSPDVRRRHVYTHTGWEQIKGRPVYLTGNGAIGASGPVDDIEVDLGSELAGYQLPRKIEDPAEAIQVSLELLDPDLAPLTLTAPLLAVMFRAPLVAALPVDVSLHLTGRTGTFKSTLTALCLCHYGGFDETHLPAGWSSTANALEWQAFLLKDAPFVVDDYAPPPLKQREFETKFDLLMRAQGNLQGRGRLRRDTSMRPTYRPRGIVISTGEGYPPGQSLLARTLLVETRHKQVNLKLLAQLQKRRAPTTRAGGVPCVAGAPDPHHREGAAGFF